MPRSAPWPQPRSWTGASQAFARNREVLLEALPAMGISEIAPPDGAFYLYADISRFGLDAVTFCERLLADTGVAITPGQRFRRRARQPTSSGSPSPARPR